MWETLFLCLKNNKNSSDLIMKIYSDYESIISERKQDNLYCPKIKFYINLEVIPIKYLACRLNDMVKFTSIRREYDREIRSKKA